MRKTRSKPTGFARPAHPYQSDQLASIGQAKLDALGPSDNGSGGDGSSHDESTTGTATPPPFARAVFDAACGDGSSHDESTTGTATAVAPPAATQTDATPTPPVDNLSKLIADQVSAAVSPIAAQVSDLSATNARLKSELDTASKQLEDLKAQNAKLKTEADLNARIADATAKVIHGQVGQPTPVAPAEVQDKFVEDNQGGSGPSLIQGGNAEFKEWKRLLDNSPRAYATYGGGNIMQRNTREADEFYLENRARVQSAIADMAKSAGLLRGSLGTNPSRDAVTVKADVPDELLVMLAQELRVTNRPRFVFPQFVHSLIELGRSPGFDTIKIARYTDIAPPASISDYQLSPGVPLVGTSQPITQQAKACTIEELGLGKNVNTQPIGISTFIGAYTLHDLIAQINEKLGQNYDAYIDLRVRKLFDTATTVLYNAGTGVTDDPADVVANSKGTMTANFIGDLLAEMQSRRVATFEDGCYALVMPPRPLAQLMRDLSAKERYRPGDLVTNVDLTTEMFRRMSGPGGFLNASKLNGYHGIYNNFHLFSSNAYGTGAAGTDGVQSETLGAGAKITRTSYAFGMRPVGHGVALPVELRERSENDFGRSRSFIWYSHEGFVALDINEGVGEDLRVIKVNTTDAEV
jgi:hypothetical protein